MNKPLCFSISYINAPIHPCRCEPRPHTAKTKNQSFLNPLGHSGCSRWQEEEQNWFLSLCLQAGRPSFHCFWIRSKHKTCCWEVMVSQSGYSGTVAVINLPQNWRTSPINVFWQTSALMNWNFLFKNLYQIAISCRRWLKVIISKKRKSCGLKKIYFLLPFIICVTRKKKNNENLNIWDIK